MSKGLHSPWDSVMSDFSHHATGLKERIAGNSWARNEQPIKI